MTKIQVRHGTFWFIPPVVFCLAVTTLDRKTDKQTDVQHPQSSASEQTSVSELNYSAADSANRCGINGTNSDPFLMDVSFTFKRYVEQHFFFDVSYEHTDESTSKPRS